MQTTPPIYDRRRLEALVARHKLRVHLKQRKVTKGHRNAGGKAPR